MSHLLENHDLSALLALLDQAATLADSVSDEQWTIRNESFRGSTLGQHMRHTLDHIETLCNGLPKGLVNYDLRIRATNVESSAATASARCIALKKELEEIGHNFAPSSPVTSLSSCSGAEPSQPQPSSFGREIQFVSSHTVHHFAILAAICHAQGIATRPDFGIATSTLKHRETTSAK